MGNLYQDEGLIQCEHKNVSTDFVTSCMHKACRQCLKSNVESVLNKSRLTIQPFYDDIKVQLMCPNQRCGMELSQEDLVDLVGINMVKEYENWLLSAFNHVYDGDIAKCLKCKKEAAIKCPLMPSNQRNGKAKISDDMNRFRNSSMVGFIKCPVSWECQNCDFSWCPACGSAFDYRCQVSGTKSSHTCREATNYMIKDIVADLELIYNDYTGGNRKMNSHPCTNTNSDDENKTNTNSDDENKIKTVWSAGTGFGGYDSPEDESTKEKVRKLEMQHDCWTERVLSSLTNLLKNKTVNHLQPLIGFSQYILLDSNDVLVKLLSFLVMNDSMLDICARGPLYIQMADLLETMATYRQLLRLINGSPFNTERGEDFDIHAHNQNQKSIMNKMKNLYEQSKIMVHIFEHEKQDKEIEADVDFTIARRLLNCYEQLAIAAGNRTPSTPTMLSVSEEKCSKMGGDCGKKLNQTSSNGDGSKNAEIEEFSLAPQNKKTLYKESLKQLQFGEYAMLEKTLHPHTYSDMFDESGSNKESIDNKGEHNKKRMLHIAKEIASLATNLPLEWESSIHLRVDPVRMDLLKALIVGPKGTPYQNGVFIFDIYLPPDYPQVPPRVTFLTGQGKVRFNPNLYVDGKICLSLLGTWPGPSWQPWKSTILQVLISFQSLIFVEYPFFNEPGEEEMNDIDAAEEDNKITRCHTLKYAILDALQNPDGCFKDIIVTHFQHKKQEIIEQCGQWISAGGGSQEDGNIIAAIAENVISLVSSL